MYISPERDVSEPISAGDITACINVPELYSLLHVPQFVPEIFFFVKLTRVTIFIVFPDVSNVLRLSALFIFLYVKSISPCRSFLFSVFSSFFVYYCYQSYFDTFLIIGFFFLLADCRASCQDVCRPRINM